MIISTKKSPCTSHKIFDRINLLALPVNRPTDFLVKTHQAIDASSIESPGLLQAFENPRHEEQDCRLQQSPVPSWP
ncbi:Os07g0270301 [Oryza sativa Japonica Group]|uniref:Os07g0270301 protein n=1 Tax=Oryza sativa subsp. japonica TaxID=39947 RepID=A0A0P0X4E2_ORYSJ|nr:hypothetical protein EE612_038413 [Oryza sativa]BAT00936.1 Os07g0270301 [Oryza sativa Japonica Group]